MYCSMIRCLLCQNLVKITKIMKKLCPLKEKLNKNSSKGHNSAKTQRSDLKINRDHPCAKGYPCINFGGCRYTRCRVIIRTSFWYIKIHERGIIQKKQSTIILFLLRRQVSKSIGIILASRAIHV